MPGKRHTLKNFQDINEYVQSLLTSSRLGKQVVFHKLLSSRTPTYGKPEKPWPPEIDNILKALGINALYRHQIDAIDLVRSGRHVVVSTPTASGKTFIYNLPVMEGFLKDPFSKALYIFPLKALAQDQLRTFNEMAGNLEKSLPSAAIYDGDTSAWHRKKIRAQPPNLIITNPEMLHLSFLPYHRTWSSFLSGLKFVVVDEVHTYRGVMGSHMAQVFRRFLRVCNFYGVKPTFIFSSATVSNPGQLAHQLTGLKVTTLNKSGAPVGRRHLLFINPLEGAAQTAILLLKAALHRGLRTIVYTGSRKLTELIALWAGSRSGKFADKISPYRAGFLPEERRLIEQRLLSGDILAVISTSALELGIDIGDLDLCLLVGYPGSIVATWQRGGRVGRSAQDSGIILISGEDALDQYFMRNPNDFLNREPEAAVVNPFNPFILERHMLCAAAELPLDTSETYIAEKSVQKTITQLEKAGELIRSEEGNRLFSRQRFPHRSVDLRGSGEKYTIISKKRGKSLGDIDAFRAFKETHPGAVYLHQGETFVVNKMDTQTRSILVSKARVDYYTRVRGHKDTEILEKLDEKQVRGTTVSLGRLKVTDQVTGYEKWSIHGKRKLNVISLDLPPLVFETEGLWIKIPPEVQKAVESRYMHFMGGIHAIEHAAIGIFPLLVMTDRNDLGGISVTYHQQVGTAAVFVYDGNPGGAGLCSEAFSQAKSILEYTLKIIRTCPCEAGCPSCVHSPKCGSGNRPIDKEAAGFILEQILYTENVEPVIISGEEAGYQKKKSDSADKIPESIHFGVLDLETQRSFQEVGGWHLANRMGISCGVLYDSEKDEYLEFLENQVPELIEYLQKLPLVVGFNINRFDYRVLEGYTDFDFRKLNTLDILDHIYRQLNFRLSLDHLARVTLGIPKSANGLQALKWWKEGRIREIVEYCKKDVEITKDLYLYGKERGFLLYTNKAGSRVRVPVSWKIHIK